MYWLDTLHIYKCEIQASKIIKNAMYCILRYLLNYAHKALLQY